MAGHITDITQKTLALQPNCDLETTIIFFNLRNGISNYVKMKSDSKK